MPNRYPNSHPEGGPYGHYGELQSGEAIHCAREVVGFARSPMASA